jgi:threonine dehydratase
VTTAPRRVREPTAEDVLRAGQVVARNLPATPVVESPLLGPGVLLKLESFQPTGSFKVRGGMVAVANVLAHHPGGRVVTASAGNHGLGVAYAARALGVPATIVLPENASSAKRSALEQFGGGVEVVIHGPTYDEAEAHALDLAADGARFVSAYNDPDVIAGQATIASELFDQVADLRAIVAPVGGGGLVAGLALAAPRRQDVDVYGVEADASPAVSASVEAGHVVEIHEKPTIADGLAGNVEPGSVTIGLIARHVRALLRADENAIRRAVRFLASEHGLVVEPSGAIGVAAVLSGLVQPGRDATVIVITGRNVTARLMADILSGES